MKASTWMAIANGVKSLKTSSPNLLINRIQASKSQFLMVLGLCTFLFSCSVKPQSTWWSRKRTEWQNKNWHDISRPELMAYLGLCIIMGINKLPRFSDYWTSDPFLENRGVKSVITKNRFEQICQYLYFSDSSLEPKKGTPGYDRLFKCRQIITNVVSNIQSAYYPFKTISIDEEMIAFKGRLNFRQYMPAKPTKYGIKVWMAADASKAYVVTLSVYQGSEGEESTNIHGLG